VDLAAQADLAAPEDGLPAEELALDGHHEAEPGERSENDGSGNDGSENDVSGNKA
jgi:hypothetical protein